MNKHSIQFTYFLVFIGITLSSSKVLSQSTFTDNQIIVSTSDPRYFKYSDGSPFIPVGLNMISPGNVETELGLSRMQNWMEKLSDNGGNFIRLWLGHDFFDIEHSKSGEYDEAKAAERLDKVLEIASELDIKVKVTFEHFRNFNIEGWDAKSLHHINNGGTATSISDFFRGKTSRDRFIEKIDWFADRYADNETIFIWELWNEVNAVEGAGYSLEYVSAQYDWTIVMLSELTERFPNRLVTQSLGSFDDPRVRLTYEAFSEISNNDIAQVHRYLDLGAALDIAHGPVDVLAADAVREIINFNVNKPVILAEGGAVEPNHTGPFELYDVDKAGVILHDVLFAPFFSGSAGVGQMWHWDRYIDENNLWFHFQRFSEVIKGVNPAVQQFKPQLSTQDNLRVYGLKGSSTSLIWCRDITNTWISELKEGKAPKIFSNQNLDIKNYIRDSEYINAKIYDPWNDEWFDGKIDEGSIKLPEFSRSLVIVLNNND